MATYCKYTHAHTDTLPSTAAVMPSPFFFHSVCLAVIWKQNHIVLDQCVNLSIVVV